MNLKKSIKIAMACSDLKQVDIVIKTDIGITTITNIATGKANPSIEIVNKIAIATGYKLSEFIALGED